MIAQAGIVWMMKQVLLDKFLRTAAVAFLLFLLLFAGALLGSFFGVIGFTLRDITALLLDAGSQWMAFLCLGIYFTAFLFFHYRASRGFWRGANPHLWLVCVLVVVATLYAIDYAPSAQALTFLASAMLGQGMAFWDEFESQNVHHVESGKKFRSQKSLALLVVFILVILLAGASVLQLGAARTFEYHSQVRWSGPWDNPNIFGLLMGTGVLLGLGLTVASFLMPSGKIGKWFCALLCLLAAILMGRGLMYSYSRGAWVGTVCGLVYMAVYGSSGFWLHQVIVNRACILRFKKCWLPLTVILASAFVIMFWHFRGTDWHPVRRAFSSVNAADFSWRNRIAAWEGDLQIMAEHPLSGVGWGQPQPFYGHYYLKPKLTETGAIELNDYLVLGATLGIPALFCFGMYVWLTLKRTAESRKHPPSPGLRRTGKAEISGGDWLQTVCHAGAIVLLVGFWFDGGLFKLPTAATFWILLELGNAGNREPRT